MFSNLIVQKNSSSHIESSFLNGISYVIRFKNVSSYQNQFVFSDHKINSVECFSYCIILNFQCESLNHICLNYREEEEKNRRASLLIMPQQQAYIGNVIGCRVYVCTLIQLLNVRRFVSKRMHKLFSCRACVRAINQIRRTDLDIYCACFINSKI